MLLWLIKREGIEAVHLHTGRTLCKLHLLEGGLHADINEDGVLVSSSSKKKKWRWCTPRSCPGNVEQGTVVIGSMEVLKPCWAVATSGVPVGFNVSICHHAARAMAASDGSNMVESPDSIGFN